MAPWNEHNSYRLQNYSIDRFLRTIAHIVMLPTMLATELMKAAIRGGERAVSVASGNHIPKKKKTYMTFHSKNVK